MLANYRSVYLIRDVLDSLLAQLPLSFAKQITAWVKFQWWPITAG